MTRQPIFLAALLLACNAISGRTQTPASAAPNPGLPAGTPLLGDDLHLFKSYGAEPAHCAVDLVAVEGQSFPQALRLTTITEPPHVWDYGATAVLGAPLHKGDVVWASFWARRLTSRKESGEAEVEVALLQTVDAKETRPLQRRLSCGPQWTRFNLPFTVANDAAAGEARLGFRFGYGQQSLEIGGVRFLNYGRSVSMDDLPRTFIRYDGWAADAPWRQAAAERIEKYRKGDLKVIVTNAAGEPVPAAQIQVRMKRHAFAWGAAIDEQYLSGDQNADDVRYQQTLEKYFNKVVFTNALKWGRWTEPGTRERVMAVLPWLEKRGIAVRGHVMLWPSWRHLPGFMADLKDDPAALKKAVAEHIAEQTATLADRLAEWDVANETYANHDLLDILGRGALADWFRQAKAGAPKTKLFYNDYTMFQTGAASQYFDDTVKFLQESGAPIEAIGEQGHFASSPPGIPDVLATLDKFGALGLPIQISEFDIDSDDAGLQADFMRDFMTAVFSHPSVMGVMQWGFWQKAHWLPRAALWDNDWNLRPHGKVWVDLVTKAWWTNADGRTDANGNYTTRGFYGDYELTVAQGGETRTVKFALSPQHLSCPVTWQ